MFEYFLIVLIFTTISLIVILFVTFKISFSYHFLNKFFHLGFLIVLMILINIYSVVIQDMKKFGASLIFLSFYSLFLIGFGYGVGSKMNVIIFFKVFADVLLYLFIGYFYFFKVESNNILEVWSKSVLNSNLEILIMIILGVYSLLGLFGFWVYWAMEASYFVSVYMHSCGFISVGWIIFLKLSLLEVVDFQNIKNFIYIISLISYIFFISIFLTVKDTKKSFGYFSASSICFLFLISIFSPITSLLYFFLSSTIKVLIFELMSFINKSKTINWWWFFWLCVIYVSNYSIFIVVPALINQTNDLIKIFVFFIFFLKTYYLFIFLTKVLILFETVEIKELREFKSKNLIREVFILFLIGVIWYLDLKSLLFSIHFLLIKHIYFLYLYVFILQITFFNWLVFSVGEGFKNFIEVLIIFIEVLKTNFENFITFFNFKRLLIYNNFKVLSCKGVFKELGMFLIFILLLWIFD